MNVPEQPQPLVNPSFTYRAVVVRVVDGDTVMVDIDLGFGVWIRNHSIRLLGVRAPEVRGVERLDGLTAKNFLIFTLSSLGVPVILQTVKDETDKYGRYLGTIWRDGESLNELLIAHYKEVFQQ